MTPGPDRLGVDPDRRPGREHLGEHHQFRTLACGAGSELRDPADGRVTVHQLAAGLDGCHPERGHRPHPGLGRQGRRFASRACGFASIIAEVERDGRARRGVNRQVQHVTAAVMTGRVELHTAGPGRSGVDLGVEDSLLAGRRARAIGRGSGSRGARRAAAAMFAVQHGPRRWPVEGRAVTRFHRCPERGHLRLSIIPSAPGMAACRQQGFACGSECSGQCRYP